MINNDFALVDVRGDGHRDVFTSDDYAFPKINHYVVRELGGPEPPGVPSGVRVTRDAATGHPVVSWSYDWGAASYEVWRSASAGNTGKKLRTTRLLRFVDTIAQARGTAFYRIRAVNKAGKSKLSTPPVRLSG